MHFLDFDKSTRELMIKVGQSFFGYGLPLDDDWTDKNLEFQHRLIDKVPGLREDEDYYDLADEIMMEIS